jgi:hypothetical protein
VKVFLGNAQMSANYVTGAKHNMALYRVQLWPGGKWDGQPYQEIEAHSAKEAAEKVHGGPLNEEGGHHQLRGRVRPLGQGEPKDFYAR